MDTSPEAAAAVLHGLFGWADGRELVEVSVKSPSGKWNSEHLDAEVVRSLDTVKRMADWSLTGRETYVGAVGLTERPAVRWRRGGAALRGHAGALWLDVDVQAPGREGQEYFEDVDEAVTAVDACLGSALAGASLVVGSGWGVQYWVPLREPVPGREASQAVRVLVGLVGECTSKKIDRVWDVTRVMRMPGTWNWRAGPDPDSARATGVIRWPRRAGGVDERLSLAGVTGELARLVGDSGGSGSGGLDALLERYGGIAGHAADDADPGAYAGSWVGDIERIATDALTWAEVLEPAGWRCVSGNEMGISADEHEQVWERPGKPGAEEGWGSGPEGVRRPVCGGLRRQTRAAGGVLGLFRHRLRCRSPRVWATGRGCRGGSHQQVACLGRPCLGRGRPRGAGRCDRWFWWGDRSGR